jgi:hypothetical protein
MNLIGYSIPFGDLACAFVGETHDNWKEPFQFNIPKSNKNLGHRVKLKI